MRDLIIYKAEINPDPESDLEVNFMGLVGKPAVERNFQVFKEQYSKFSVDEEKRIISGVAMIADMPIYRRDKDLGEFYVVFDKPSIQKIVEKFSYKGYLRNINLFHDTTLADDKSVIFNSFISDKEIGIHPPKGFEDVPDGSWFISIKVNTDETWERVKAGDLKGFSIEGLFNYIPVAKIRMTAEALAAQIEYLLNNTEIID